MKRSLLGMELTIGPLVIVLGSLFFFVTLLGGWTINVDKGKTLVDILNGLASLFLLIVELCAIVIAIFILLSYFRYRRPYKFVFEGFSNAAKLVEAQSKPIDINSLAQEELERQFRIIYNQLKEYANKGGVQIPSGSRKKHATNISIFLSENQNAEADLQLSEIGWNLPSKDILPYKKRKDLMHTLKETMRCFGDSGVSSLISSIEESAPKEIAPIMRLIDILVPPPVIKVICHLQWKNDSSDEVGITFEIIDLTKSRWRVLRNKTLWLKKPSSCTTQQFSKLAMAIETSTEMKSTLTEDYIKLLGPAMRWLVLLSWEHYTRTEHAKLHQGESYPSELLYLLGALCYVSADHFPVCHDFFKQCAFDCLSKADEDRYPGLSLPYFYLAERTLGKARNARGKNCYKLLLLETQDQYEQALDCARKGKAPRVIQNYIKIRQALAILDLDDTQLTKKTELEIDELTASDEIRQVAALNSREDVADCSLYLYNLARWYEDRGVTQARRYLIYSFVLCSYQWDQIDPVKDFEEAFKDFGSFQNKLFTRDPDSTHLRKLLESVLVGNEDPLPKPTDDQFQDEVEAKIIRRWEEKAKERKTFKGSSNILDIQHMETAS